MATEIKEQSVSRSTGMRCMDRIETWPACTLQTVATEGGRLGRGKQGLLYQTLIPVGDLYRAINTFFEVISRFQSPIFHLICLHDLDLDVYVLYCFKNVTLNMSFSIIFKQAIYYIATSMWTAH